MKKISINKKRNYILNDIYDYITDTYDYISELIRYKTEFPKEPDYNYVQYANMVIYDSDIRELYIFYGYSVSKLSKQKLWNKYMYDVRTVIDYILEKES